MLELIVPQDLIQVFDELVAVWAGGPLLYHTWTVLEPGSKHQLVAFAEASGSTRVRILVSRDSLLFQWQLLDGLLEEGLLLWRLGLLLLSSSGVAVTFAPRAKCSAQFKVISVL